MRLRRPPSELESTNPPGNLFPQREADTDHLQMASFVVAVLDVPDRHPYPGTALTILVEMASFVVAVLDSPDRHHYPGTVLTILVEKGTLVLLPPGRAMQEWLFADHLKMASFVVAVLDSPDRHHYPGTALTILVEVPEYVRGFTHTTFQAMLEHGTERDLHLALRSLVPVLLHLRDDSSTVIKKQRALAGRGAFCKAELCSGCPGLPAKGCGSPSPCLEGADASSKALCASPGSSWATPGLEWARS
ncbi:UNVERIFIED_CONTAM: hypothetical protein K2H54_004748, partial [Gekko kuhli]